VAKPKKQLHIPGLYGDLVVKLVSRRTILKRCGLRSTKGTVINGLYLDASHEILIASELEPHARVATLMHEIQHALLDSTDTLDEEAKCDVLGAYMLRILTEPTLQAAVQELSTHA